jgi:hypothetical protein
MMRDPRRGPTRRRRHLRQEIAMFIVIVGWALLAALCVGLALNLPARQALQSWAAVTAVGCVLGAFAIASQPLGQATFAGRLGSILLRWGFKESQGRLPIATLVSWLVWVGIGAATIAFLRARGDWAYRGMILAWAVDGALLAYVLGVWLAKGSGRAPSLLIIAIVLVAMIAGSAALWSRGPEAAKRLALVLAGGPPLMIGVGYGLFLIVVLTVGRNARWN